MHPQCMHARLEGWKKQNREAKKNKQRAKRAVEEQSQPNTHTHACTVQHTQYNIHTQTYF